MTHYSRSSIVRFRTFMFGFIVAPFFTLNSYRDWSHLEYFSPLSASWWQGRLIYDQTTMPVTSLSSGVGP